jgi:hypothetical protein
VVTGEGDPEKGIELGKSKLDITAMKENVGDWDSNGSSRYRNTNTNAGCGRTCFLVHHPQETV